MLFQALLQSEAECEAIEIKIIFYSHANKTRFHKKSFAFCLVLKWEFLELGNGLLYCSKKAMETSLGKLWREIATVCKMA